ncbi:MAG: hypothetical protein MT490_17390 [Sphingomonas sp.]|uniref:hypothetical protein n=1 Tax=Sphingomonas sp. TaxID=28214 RepID=UPI002275860C|nr:hypothetical protein [Sphingomonas sp.]MCX8477566.1 hypothetical protein [Sphingomonas sp.]
MTGFAVAVLFGATFATAGWALYASIRPQFHRFADLFRPTSMLPALPPRLSRVTVRAVPARLAARAPLRAAA